MAAAGANLTHPGRVVFDTPRITKRGLARYYAAVSGPLLAHAQDRPLSLVRCPGGVARGCFFQKHVTAQLPAAIGRVRIREKSGQEADYPVLTGPESLAACAQIGVVELHLWASRAQSLEHPDRMVFDLDPAPDLSFAAVRKAAFDLRDILAGAGLSAYPLLTGGKGVHLVLPVAPMPDWDSFLGFARSFAAAMAAREPGRFVATSRKAERMGRIFIDHLRNGRGSTAIAPFSPRARAGAPVAVPVSWAQLESIERASAFSMTDVPAVLAQADAWGVDPPPPNRIGPETRAALGLDREA